jgi:hypothetical protein
MSTGSKQVLCVQSPMPRKNLDYEVYNYCATCKIKYPKDILKLWDVPVKEYEKMIILDIMKVLPVPEIEKLRELAKKTEKQSETKQFS